MNPYGKVLRSLLRFVALGMVVISGMLAGLEWLRHRVPDADFSSARLAAFVLVFIAGAVLFAVSGRLAARFTTDDVIEAKDPDAPANRGE